MPEFKYMIVGAGMTADAAVEGIRGLDPEGTICVIGDEPDPPYMRPPLSKLLWKSGEIESIWLDACARNADLRLQRRVVSIDPSGHTVTDDIGTQYGYGKLLLATGGYPKRLPFGGDDVIYFRTVADYNRLRGLTGQAKSFVVVGGGFIGSEIAAALAINDQRVTMIFPENAIGSRVYPPDLAASINDYYGIHDVHVIAGDVPSEIERTGQRVTVRTRGGVVLEVDGVVAGLGIAPDVSLAENAGLQVDNGVVVDSTLRATHPDVFAAGDVAAFHNPLLDKRVRLEHVDNAQTMGRHAGRNMAGASEPYDYLPMFYSDLFDLGYEAVGEIDASLATYSDWQEPFQKGVVYYLNDNRVRGVLLWNVWDKVDEARTLMSEPGPFLPADLKGRIA